MFHAPPYLSLCQLEILTIRKPTRIAKRKWSIYKGAMDLSNSALRAELGSALKELTRALEAFAGHIRQEARAVWMWTAPTGSELPRGDVALSDLSRSEVPRSEVPRSEAARSD